MAYQVGYKVPPEVLSKRNATRHKYGWIKDMDSFKKKVSNTLKGRKILWADKISQSNFGKHSNPRNIVGLTPLNQMIRSLTEYELWRKTIFIRDDYTCQNCKERGGILEAHHIEALSNLIRKFNITKWEDSINCSRIWDINNGITLCRECHKKTDNYSNKAKI